MTQAMYQILVSYMEFNMKDAAHDQAHVYRVLHTALQLAKDHPEADTDVLIAACLLHDIGRDAQFKDPSVCHARFGGEMAYRFLLEQGWDETSAAHVRDCISSHRFRGDNSPKTIEAKILFDADKLDVTGAVGIARTLLYQGQVGYPLYTLTKDGALCPGQSPQDPPSFFREYHFKLKNLYSKFYTQSAQQLAAQREEISIAYFHALEQELAGADSLISILED